MKFPLQSHIITLEGRDAHTNAMFYPQNKIFDR